MQGVLAQVTGRWCQNRQTRDSAVSAESEFSGWRWRLEKAELLLRKVDGPQRAGDPAARLLVQPHHQLQRAARIGFMTWDMMLFLVCSRYRRLEFGEAEIGVEPAVRRNVHHPCAPQVSPVVADGPAPADFAQQGQS